jgi:hypothetical protein
MDHVHDQVKDCMEFDDERDSKLTMTIDLLESVNGNF